MAVGGIELDLPDRIHEELLICKICYSKFSNKAENLPKLLVCSHTFCINCITEYLRKRKKKSKFPCPLCRKETLLPKDGVKGLTNNYTILGLLDLLDTKPQPDPYQGNSRCSRTIHSSSRLTRSASQRVKSSKKWSSVPRGVEPAFKDLGGSPTEQERPPSKNPNFSLNSSSHSAPSPSNSPGKSTTLSPGCKPELPVRIPGAPSSIRGTNSLGKLLTMDRLESMSFPTAPTENPYEDDEQSLLSETIEGEPPSPQRYTTPPKPPPRRVSSESVAATPIRCLKKFGRYSETRMQTNAFTQPTRVTMSKYTGDILVIDALQMTVQIFTGKGEYISMFKVVGIQGACYMGPDKIATSTHRGVELYAPNGERLKELQIGNTVNTIPYKFGFIAAKTRSLSFFSNNLQNYKDIKKIKTGRLKSMSFHHIQDIALNSLDELIVLDGGRCEIYVMDTNGAIKITINPTKDACGALKEPGHLTTDKWNSILVSDTGNSRVLKFSANGNYARCLLNYKIWGTAGPESDLKPQGVCVCPGRDKMVLVVLGDHKAHVSIYQL